MRRTLLIPLVGILAILVVTAFALWYWSIERSSDLEAVRSSIALFVSVIVLVAAVSGWVMYRALLVLYIRPIRQLRLVAEQAGRGELHETAIVHRDDDVGELSRSINQMIDNLRQAKDDALAESERRFRELVESANAIPWEFDPVEERFTFVGPQAEPMLGYPTDAWYEPGFWSEHVHPADRERAQAFLRRAARGEEVEAEYRMSTSAGGEVWFRDIVTFAPDADGGGLLRGVRFDVTDRRALQEQLFRSQRLEAVGQLAGGIAHDFNNLLTVVAANASAARSQLEVSSEVAEELREIERAANRGSALTHQLLAYARKQAVSPRVVDLNAVVVDLEHMLERLAGQAIPLETRMAEGLWAVRVDPGQIEQVITNLVVNARDASPAGGTITVSTRNETITERSADRREMPSGEYVTVSVADRGEGMDAATRDRIFEPFFSTKGVGEGTGLGLSTCYGIVKQSGGFIWVDTAPGRGSTFEVFLPRVTDPVDASPPSTAASGDAGRDREGRGTESVVVVDDEEAVRRLTERALVRYGYRVEAFARGIDAVAAAAVADRPFHLLLTDLVMPDMDGKEVAERIRAVQPSIRVLFTSGYSPDRFFDPHDLGSRDAFLQKPFVPGTLVTAVRDLLDQTAPEGD